jgi:hypothetical protein
VEVVGHHTASLLEQLYVHSFSFECLEHIESCIGEGPVNENSKLPKERDLKECLHEVIALSTLMLEDKVAFPNVRKALFELKT